MKVKMYTVVASLLGLVAMGLVQTACRFWFFQPEEDQTPKCLSK